VKGRRISVFRLSASVLSLLLPLVALPSLLVHVESAAASVASPSVSGPVGGGSPAEWLFSTNFNLAQVGYQEREFFISGTAKSYTSSTLLTPDGKWNNIVPTGATAPYTTRVVVRRPIDPTRFNGTVIVEWINVSGGVDAAPDWTQSHNELIRDGFAWVGVSAQWLGVQADKGLNPSVVPGDPVRYGPLSHPGDSFSYDIFSQAGQAIRDNAAQMLGGLTPQKLIAMGISQSAGRLVTYINAIQPLDHEYDGFLVHSEGAVPPPPLQQTTPGAPPPPPPGQEPIPVTPNDAAPMGTTFRNDLDVPVFLVQTETDIAFSNASVRQPDTGLFRSWEVAGTSHFDWYGLDIGPKDTGNGQGAVLNLTAELNPPKATSAGTCNLAINTGPAHWVLDAAVYSTNQWVTNGTLPPIAQPLQITSKSPVVFTTDANGNTLGGVRTPQVDVPVATFEGIGNTPFPNCILFGTTVPFSQAKLASLYNNHGSFVSQWAHAAQNEVKAGFLRPADAEELIGSAASSSVGK
jgi:hypothetical protein